MLTNCDDTFLYQVLAVFLLSIKHLIDTVVQETNVGTEDITVKAPLSDTLRPASLPVIRNFRKIEHHLR